MPQFNALTTEEGQARLPYDQARERERAAETTRQAVELRVATEPPVRLTSHETSVWYRLSAHEGEVVTGQDLLWIGWGSGYNWDHPDPTVREDTRQLVQGVIYMLRRLLEANGRKWEIQSEWRKGYRLVRGTS